MSSLNTATRITAKAKWKKQEKNKTLPLLKHTEGLHDFKLGSRRFWNQKFTMHIHELLWPQLIQIIFIN